MLCMNVFDDDDCKAAYSTLFFKVIFPSQITPAKVGPAELLQGACSTVGI